VSAPRSSLGRGRWRRAIGLGLTCLLASSGVATAEVRTGAIDGGIDADPSDWPFLVGLLAHGTRDPFAAQGCAGSVIGSAVVLTAAHCVTSADGTVTPAPRLEVLVGTGVLRRGAGQRVRVAEVHVHPAWNRRRGTGDAAALVLAAPLAAPAVRLPTADEPGLDRPGGWVRVAGWGRDGDSSFPRELQELRYTVQGPAWCARRTRADGDARRYAHGVTLCAEDVNHVRGTCAGDSGGPLVARDAAGATVLVGIVSYGPAACGSAPDVYTRVRAIAAWAGAQAARVPPAPITPPVPVVRLRGDRRAGMELRCVVAGRDPQRAHYLYRWLREGRPIRDATGVRFVPSPRDVGRAVRCRVTASATGGEATGLSRPVVIRSAPAAARG
jgi:secreted trypsin-like serine protease